MHRHLTSSTQIRRRLQLRQTRLVWYHCGKIREDRVNSPWAPVQQPRRTEKWTTWTRLMFIGACNHQVNSRTAYRQARPRLHLLTQSSSIRRSTSTIITSHRRKVPASKNTGRQQQIMSQRLEVKITRLEARFSRGKRWQWHLQSPNQRLTIERLRQLPKVRGRHNQVVLSND